jgi:hypothetical protein
MSRGRRRRDRYRGGGGGRMGTRGGHRLCEGGGGGGHGCWRRWRMKQATAAVRQRRIDVEMKRRAVPGPR